jgi:hypothetical protein
MDNSNRPDIRASRGATGSGKGVSIREHLRKEKPKRLVIWDPLSEYAEFAKPARTLADCITAMGAGSFKVAFTPGGDVKGYADKFALLCRAVFAAGNCTFLVEELADVTSASYAPLEWRRCTTQGRHRGLKIIAASQRPAQVDKQFLGGCTYMRCFTLRYPQDRAAMAGAMSVRAAQIEELQTIETHVGTEIMFFEKDFRSGKTTKNTIKLQKK